MVHIDTSLRRNIHLFYMVTALEYAFFNDAILILFGREYLRLNYFQAGSLFFIGWFVSILFDFWGGVTADKIGRQQSTVIGIGLQLVSYVPYMFSKSYPLLVMGSVLWGLGVALSANALHALIYEQVSAGGKTGKKSYAHISATSQILLFVSVGIATVIGGFAYKIDPRLPYALMMVTLLAALILTCFIYAPVHIGQKSVDEESKMSTARLALRTFQLNTPLRNFVIIGFLAGIFGDLLFGYYQPYYIDLKVSAVTLGILFGSLRAASAIGSFIMRRLSNSIDPSLIQGINIAGIMITAALMHLFKLPVALAAPLIFGITSGLVEPNMRLYVNSHASDRVRASVLSFSTTTMSLGVGIGFVLAYYLADAASSATVLGIVIIGAAMTIALRLYYSRMTA